MITPKEFQRLAHEALASLLPDSTAKRTGDCMWTAASTGVVATVEYEPALAELSLWLQQADQEDQPFEISDILRVTNCPEASWQRLVNTHTADPSVAADLLDFATSCVRAFGTAFLDGDERAFAEARVRRSERAAAYTGGINLAPTLRSAGEAWTARDLRRVVEILGPVREHLSDSEARRLAFAESRLGRRTLDEDEA